MHFLYDKYHFTKNFIETLTFNYSLIRRYVTLNEISKTTLLKAFFINIPQNEKQHPATATIR